MATRQRHDRPARAGRPKKKPNAPLTLDAKAIGRRMRRARKDRGFDLYDMSRETGIMRMTLACYECGARVPILRNAVTISLALRRKLDWLILGKRSRIDTKSRKPSPVGRRGHRVVSAG